MIILLNIAIMAVFVGVTLLIWRHYRRRLEKEVGRAQKSEQLKTVFLANVSHALRTPLNSVIGFSDLILKEGPANIGEEQMKEMITHINKNGRQLLYFVSELLELSAYEGSVLTFTKVEVNLAELMASYRRETLPEAHPSVGVRIRTDLSPHCKATLDTNLTHQLVMHLMKNAARHTEKGSVTLEYGRERNGLRVNIIDTGRGLPEKFKNSDPFSMLHIEDALTLEGEASGLGLSICKSIVDSLHGEISIDSEKDKGTTASFWIPCRMRDMTKTKA